MLCLFVCLFCIVLINENDQLRDPVVFRQVLENEMQAIRDNLVNYDAYQYAANFLES